MSHHAYILALSAAMGSVFYGWDIGLIGGVLSMPSFQSYFGIDKMSPSQQANINGNIVSVLQAGCLFGALITVWTTTRFGRKPSLLASGVIYIIGSLIQSIVGLGSSQTVALRVLYLSRFIGGIGVGMVSALVPSYVSECTPRKIRGRCTGMIQLANNIGIMLSFWVNYGTAKDLPTGEMQWRIPFIVQIFPGILFLILMIFQPESPRWLVEQGDLSQAQSVLARVSGLDASDPHILLTISEIKSEFQGQNHLSLRKQFIGMGQSRVIALRCFIPSLVMFFQQWTGTNAINYFSPQIFATLGITGTTNGLFATGIYGVVKVVCVSLTLLFAVEKMGRKVCLIFGGLGQGLTMLWIGGYDAIHPEGKVVPASYVSIIAVYLYGAAYAFGWGPVPWVCAGEVAPNHLRTMALSIAVVVNWLFSLCISKITPILLEEITYGTFLLFGFCCLVMAVWAYACYPETSGYALEDIKYLFERDVIIRSLQDAPGGKIFLRGRRAAPIEELRRAEADGDGDEDALNSNVNKRSVDERIDPV